jgi:TetR/AcrR family transcriptional regulator, transcriptional repressor of aconitase
MSHLDPIIYQMFKTQLSKGDSKRAEIIQAAIHVFAHDGIEGGTLDRIAKRLKTRRSHIAYYYADKDDLLADVIQLIIANAQKITVDLLSTKKSPEEQILAMVEAAFEWAKLYPGQAKVLLLFFSVCVTRSKFRKLNTQIREIGYQRLRALLEKTLVEQTPSNSNLDDIARALHANMTGILIDFMATDINTSVDLREVALRSCRQIIDALKLRKS